MTGNLNPMSGAMRPSVQHVTTSLNMGGAQAMLVKLIERGGADPLCHNIVSLLSPGVMAGACRRAECPVYSPRMKRRLPGPLAFLKLLRITGRIRPDLIQGWMYHGNIAASIAAHAQPRRLPVVWTVRHSLAELEVESPRNRALFALSATLSRGTSAIIYNSRVAARQHEAIGFAPDRSVHIPNGFDCARYRPDRSRRQRLLGRFGIDGKAIVVGLIARLHPMKDHAMMVEAVARTRGAGHDIHLLMVGTDLDSPPPALAARIANLLPPDRVTLAGEHRDVSEWLPGLDIVALSSAWGEAFPNILGEAMACGVPCATTDVGDSAWVLGGGGEVVPPKNAEAMAAALGRLATSVETRHRIGDALRARVVQHFEIEQVARQYRRLYFALLEGKDMPTGMRGREAEAIAGGRAG